MIYEIVRENLYRANIQAWSKKRRCFGGTCHPSTHHSREKLKSFILDSYCGQEGPLRWPKEVEDALGAGGGYGQNYDRDYCFTWRFYNMMTGTIFRKHKDVSLVSHDNAENADFTSRYCSRTLESSPNSISLRPTARKGILAIASGIRRRSMHTSCYQDTKLFFRAAVVPNKRHILSAQLLSLPYIVPPTTRKGGNSRPRSTL